MFTFLDLLVIVFMALAALSLFAVCLMFLVKNRKVRKVCFYITVALGIYAAYIGIRIFRDMFFLQTVLSIVLGLASIGSLVLERVRKDNDQAFLIARILSAVALLAGLLNAFS